MAAAISPDAVVSEESRDSSIQIGEGTFWSEASASADGTIDTSMYQDFGDFRETVNRYIHEFEAMLRSVLSTRDGHALAVTLLSSDMGKLYVALAQAIERLRA